MPHTLHIVDVFAERQYAGNQLAVVLDAADLSAEQMEAIARETNYSETTFVTARDPSQDAYPVRIFTPAGEIPFAGHPTLGTAWVIRNHVAVNRPDTIHLRLGVGDVAVTFAASGQEELVWLSAPPVRLGATFPAEQVAPALQIAAEDVDERAPVQSVSAGLAMVIVPLRSLDALRRSRLNLSACASLMERGFIPIVYLFCRETHASGNDLCARMFFEAQGVREDPATGSAAACLGAYLLEHDYFARSELSLRIEQGHEVLRPSLVRLRARQTETSREISVGGQVIPTIEGQLL